MTSRGVIFRRSLVDARWAILGWGIAIGLLSMFVIMLFPTMTQFEGLAELLESPIYKAFLGEGADAAAFLTPQGFFAVYVVLFTPIYIAIYMVLLGLGATAGEEDRHTIDLILSTPTPRWQLVVEKGLAALVITIALLVINMLFCLLGVAITPDMPLTFEEILRGTLSMLPISLVFVGIALLLATLLKSRYLAGALTGLILLVAYMLTTLSEVATEALGTVKYLSFFSYHRGVVIMMEGMQWGDFLLLCVVAIVLFVLAIGAFQRRDLAA